MDFFSALRRYFRHPLRVARSTQPKSALCRTVQLNVEALEGREVPAVMTVNSTSDANSRNSFLSLREAMLLNTGGLTFSSLTTGEKAQVSGSVGSNDRIKFSVTGTITLTADMHTLDKKLIIEGPGASSLTIDGNYPSLFRPLYVNSQGDVTVSGLKFEDCTGTSESGAVAVNNGKLTFSRVSFYNSNVSGGGGGQGGAIYNSGAGVLTIDECDFFGNLADGLGGAIANYATAKISDTSFRSNFATGNGGAVWSGSSDGNLTLTNCTFDNNSSNENGGALRVAAGTVTIVSCTFTNNKASLSGGSETGGGINSAVGFSMINSVVAQNTSNARATKDDITGNVFTTAGPNVVGVNTGLTGITNGQFGNRVGTNSSPIDPLLYPVAADGGFALTRTPKPGSILLGGGSFVSSTGQTDQRGAGRSGAITIGAVQVANPLSPVGPSSQLFGPGPIATSNEAYVKGLYRACLLRDADPAGLANWVNILNNDPGARAQVAHGFYNSYENRRNQVTFFYKYFLGRTPDQAGLDNWIQVLQSGVDEALVVRGFALSDEFTGQTNNTQFVNTMYYAMLGRNADPQGFNDWKTGLDTNRLSRAQMIDAFLRSTETVQRVVTSNFQSYLGVSPATDQVNFFTAAIQAGTTFGAAAEAVLASTQFYNAAAAKVGP